MNATLLDNWENANLEGLERRKNELTKEIRSAKWNLENLEDEMTVISYYIGKREGESHDQQ